MTKLKSPELTWPRLLAFSAPAVPLALLLIPLTTLLPTYYSQTTGLSLQAIGFVFLLARLGDGIIDPIVGILSDRTPARFGRRRSWMIAGCGLTLLGCWLVFFPGARSTAVTLTLSLFVLYAGWTMVAVPHYSWASELSNSYTERSRIAGIRDGMYFVGVITGAILIGVLSHRGAGIDRSILTALGLLAMILLPALIALCVLTMPDGRAPPLNSAQDTAQDTAQETAKKDAPRATIRGEIQAVLGALNGNPPLRRLLGAYACAHMAGAVTNVLAFLFVEHVHAGKQAVGLLVLVFFGATLAGLPLWVRLSYRYTKHRMCAVCCAVLIATATTVFLLPGNHLTAYLVVIAIAGLANGGALSLPNAIIADVVDYDTLRHREDRAGLLFSLKLLIAKLVNAAAVGITFPVLGLAGFQATGQNTDSALFALRLVYCILPIAMLAGAIFLLWNFPLEPRRVGIISRRLESRRGRALRAVAGKTTERDP